MIFYLDCGEVYTKPMWTLPTHTVSNDCISMIHSLSLCGLYPVSNDCVSRIPSPSWCRQGLAHWSFANAAPQAETHSTSLQSTVLPNVEVAMNTCMRPLAVPSIISLVVTTEWHKIKHTIYDSSREDWNRSEGRRAQRGATRTRVIVWVRNRAAW